MADDREAWPAGSTWHATVFTVACLNASTTHQSKKEIYKGRHLQKKVIRKESHLQRKSSAKNVICKEIYPQRNSSAKKFIRKEIHPQRNSSANNLSAKEFISVIYKGSYRVVTG